MPSLKIAVKAGGLPDIKVKLKIEMENNPRKTAYFPQTSSQADLHDPCPVDLPETNSLHTETPEVVIHSGSLWQNFLSRIRSWRRA